MRASCEALAPVALAKEGTATTAGQEAGGCDERCAQHARNAGFDSDGLAEMSSGPRGSAADASRGMPPATSAYEGYVYPEHVSMALWLKP